MNFVFPESRQKFRSTCTLRESSQCVNMTVESTCSTTGLCPRKPPLSAPPVLAATRAHLLMAFLQSLPALVRPLQTPRSRAWPITITFSGLSTVKLTSVLLFWYWRQTMRLFLILERSAALYHLCVFEIIQRPNKSTRIHENLTDGPCRTP